MSATATQILAAIDDAILTWSGRAARIRKADGSEVEFHSLDELMRARKVYAALSATESGGQGFGLTPLAAGGAS